MLLDDLATYLNGLSLGAPVQRGFFQEIPDSVIALRETGGFPSEYVMGTQGNVIEEPTVQIVARATTYQAAMILCRTVYDALNGLRDVTINSVLYHFIRAMQPPFFLMRDTNNRFECAFNIHITRRTVP